MSIKSYEGAEAKRIETNRLPAGGYICSIMAVEIEQNTWGDRLVLKFDITDGKYLNYFADRYNNRTFDDEKWKGVMRIRIPDKSHQFFESERKTFNNAIFAFEASNKDFHWAWDEKSLVGKNVGILFRNAEWEKDGRTGWYSEPCALVTVEDIVSGNFKVPKDKPLKNKTKAEEAFTPVSEDDCPF